MNRRQHPFELDGFVDAMVAGPSRLAPDIQYVRTRFPQALGAFRQPFGVGQAVAGKRVRRRVDDPHNVRAAAPVETNFRHERLAAAQHGALSQPRVAEFRHQKRRAGNDQHVAASRATARFDECLDGGFDPDRRLGRQCGRGARVRSRLRRGGRQQKTGLL